MSRWVYWVSLAFIAVVVAVPVISILTDPLMDVRSVFKLGVDLEGGTSLIYQLRAREGSPPPDANEARRIILNRIDPTGVRGYTVRPLGRTRLEIVIPGRRARLSFDAAEPITPEMIAAETAKAAPAEALQVFQGGTRLIVRTKPALYIRDIEGRIGRAVNWRPIEKSEFRVVGLEWAGQKHRQEFDKVAVWVPARPDDAAGLDAWRSVIRAGLSTNPDVEDVKRLVGQAGFLEFRIVAERVKDRDKADFDHLVALKKAGRPSDNPAFRWYRAADDYYTDLQKHGLPPEWVYVADAASKTVELLVRVDDGQNITGRDLAAAWRDSQRGDPIVSFSIRVHAQDRMAILTKPDNKGRYLAIILDGVVQSAPVLRAQLSSGGIIEGYRNRQRERDEVVTVLNSGQLAASLGDPIFERTVGPELGEDNIHKGIRATVLGLVLVLIFMVVLYFFAGLVADLALLLNVVMLVSIMYIVDQAWTLPGIAGLILTVGMSVDANVLVFERLREEKGREGSLGFALQRAYSRAFRTILDANVTTLIPAVVLLLPWLATEEMKGFAVVMVVGIGLSMFTAIVVTRMVFETGMKWGLVKDLRMMRMFRAPNFQWMRFARYAVVVSGGLVLVGAITFYGRSESKYDIEFTGGTQVALALRVPGSGEAEKIEQVRGRISGAFGPGAVVQALDVEKRPGEEDLDYFLVSVSSVGRQGEQAAGEAEVKEKLRGLFADMWPKTGQGVDVAATASQITVDLIRARLEAARAVGGGAEAPAAGPAPPAPAAETPAATGYLYIPDEYRRFIGQVRLQARLGLGLSEQDVREEMVRFLRERHPDLADTEVRVRGLEAGGRPGRFTALDIWVRDAFEGQRANVSKGEFWTGVLRGALGKREFLSVTSFEPTMAGETWRKAVVAIVFSMGGIILYMWIRFAKFAYGVAAIVALVHDVFLVVGAVAASAAVAAWWAGNPLLITDMKINMPMVGAFLTLIGYSLNDTIVVFDRIRENRGKFGDLSVEVTNRSINQTLTRTVWTSLTTFMVVVVLYVLGGSASTLHGFAFVMTLGVLVGTYSSVAIASPVLVMRDYLRRAYAAAFPVLALGTMVFVLVWSAPGRPVPAVLVGLWFAWTVPAAWGTWCHAAGRPWPLEAKARWLVKGLSAAGLLAPLVLVVTCGAMLVAPPGAGWEAWAGPAAVGALFTTPAALGLYHAAWGSLFQKT